MTETIATAGRLEPIFNNLLDALGHKALVTRTFTIDHDNTDNNIMLEALLISRNDPDRYGLMRVIWDSFGTCLYDDRWNVIWAVENKLFEFHEWPDHMIAWGSLERVLTWIEQGNGPFPMTTLFRELAKLSLRVRMKPPGPDIPANIEFREGVIPQNLHTFLHGRELPFMAFYFGYHWVIVPEWEKHYTSIEEVKHALEQRARAWLNGHPIQLSYARPGRD